MLNGLLIASVVNISSSSHLSLESHYRIITFFSSNVINVNCLYQPTISTSICHLLSQQCHLCQLSFSAYNIVIHQSPSVVTMSSNCHHNCNAKDENVPTFFRITHLYIGEQYCKDDKNVLYNIETDRRICTKERPAAKDSLHCNPVQEQVFLL